jgi:hypothetical protein
VFCKVISIFVAQNCKYPVLTDRNYLIYSSRSVCLFVIQPCREYCPLYRYRNLHFQLSISTLRDSSCTWKIHFVEGFERDYSVNSMAALWELFWVQKWHRMVCLNLMPCLIQWDVDKLNVPSTGQTKNGTTNLYTVSQVKSWFEM